MRGFLGSGRKGNAENCRHGKSKSVAKECGRETKFGVKAHHGESVWIGRTLRYRRWVWVFIMENGFVEQAVSGREAESRPHKKDNADEWLPVHRCFQIVKAWARRRHRRAERR